VVATAGKKITLFHSRQPPVRGPVLDGLVENAANALRRRVIFGLATAMAAGLSSAPGVADVGIRDFADTIIIDDPEINDQLIGPTFSWQRFGGGDGSAGSSEIDLGFEVDKRITTRLGLQISDAASWISTSGEKQRSGFRNLQAGLQFEVFRNAKHEFITSVGVMRVFGDTGSTQVGADQTGSTIPLVFAGKGLGDVPAPILRPLAVTGEFGYAAADRSLKQISPSPAGVGTPLSPPVFNKGLENRWQGGFTVQYPLGYLDGEVYQLNLPEWVDNLTPLVEVAWSSPAKSPSRQGVTWLFAPGVIWANGFFQFGVEALIPGNAATGKNVGVIAQFRMALGNFAPALNKPLFRPE
jgi:hypothetical protein